MPKWRMYGTTSFVSVPINWVKWNPKKRSPSDRWLMQLNMTKTDVMRLQHDICGHYYVGYDTPLYVVVRTSPTGGAISLVPFVEMCKIPSESGYTLTTRPFVSPNGLLSTRRYLYATSGVQIKAGHVVLVAGKVGRFTVIRGAKGDVDNPFVKVKDTNSAKRIKVQADELTLLE